MKVHLSVFVGVPQLYSGALAAVLLSVVLFTGRAVADQPDVNADKKEAVATSSLEGKSDEGKSDKDPEAKTDKEEPKVADDFAVPDRDANKLFAFIRKTMAGNRGHDRNELLKAARAVVDAAAKIRTLDDVTVPIELKAIEQQLGALQFLVRVDKDAQAELADVLKVIGEDERPEIRNFAVMEKMKSEIRSIPQMDAEEQKKFIGRFNRLMDESGVGMSTYSLATQIARGLQAAEQTELATSFYNDLADRLEKSEDERLQKMADRARGSARRLSLPGNPIELSGKNADGEQFDWAAYQGKVVLVDFWASWCGPCRAEIPNMKRNLALYPNDFSIVGINMDRTDQARQKYIDKEEIGWENIVGDRETGSGWDHPIARHYGVSGIPTAILVDRDGKVVSLSARGKRLDALLKELIGPPAENAKSEEETP